VKLKSLAILFVVTMSLLISSNAFVYAYSTDFEGYVSGTTAVSLTIPGMTFAGSASIRTANPTLNFVNTQMLAEINQTLTITFAQPQASVSFGWAQGNSTPYIHSVTVVGFLGGSQVANQNFTGVVNAPVCTNCYEGRATLNVTVDQIVISFSTNDQSSVIDEITTTDVVIGSSPSPAAAARFTDGRVNDLDIGAPVAVYCVEGDIRIYAIDGSSVGSLLIDESDLSSDAPQENTLLASDGGTRLYQLTSGEFQVNSAVDAEGKVYVLVWTGCPHSGLSSYMFNTLTQETTRLGR
jgi:hypothetical protein